MSEATSKKVVTSIVGASAEHFVMYRLLREGLVAALAPKGVPEVDILVTDRKGNSLAEIQVKGRQYSKDGGWTMNVKHEHDDLVRERLFYCFVDLGKAADDVPQCWLMPSRVVADVLKRSHKAWLETPGKNGRAHVDWPMRRICVHYDFDPAMNRGWMDKYKDAWVQLKAAS
jgi:hypothetical protein